MPAAELRHAEDPARRLARRCQPVKRLIIHIVHRDDPVEAFEILLPDLTRPVGQRIAAPRSRTPHPRIGQFAPMSAVGPRRIHLDPLRKSRKPGLRSQNALGGRGAADVAQTDKQYTCFHRPKDTLCRTPYQISSGEFPDKIPERILHGSPAWKNSPAKLGHPPERTRPPEQFPSDRKK